MENFRDVYDLLLFIFFLLRLVEHWILGIYDKYDILSDTRYRPNIELITFHSLHKGEVPSFVFTVSLLCSVQRRF
jgi:hypothetical protein